MSDLKPWAHGPFELILHAELHRLQGNDFDRRIALISFDNSIEVSITTYLTLNPLQRGGRQYQRTDVGNWLENYHTKLDFLETELQNRSIPFQVPKEDIIWYHDIRNDQYHGGARGIPEEKALKGIREAALWIFSILFDIQDVEDLLETEVLSRLAPQKEELQNNPTLDKLLDSDPGSTFVALHSNYSASEILRRTDPDAYKEELASLVESPNFIKALRKKYPQYLRSDIDSVQIIHYNETVYLKTVGEHGDISLEDMGYIISDIDDSEMFSATTSPARNVKIFLDSLDPYSIIMCTNLFTQEACNEIEKKNEENGVYANN